MIDVDATIQSYVPQVEERRREDRYRTLFQVAHVTTDDGDEHLCIVRNISAGGLLLEIYAPFFCETHLTVVCRGCQPLAGRVRWCNDSRAGIVFDARLDVDTYLHRESDIGIARPPRITLSRDAQLRWGTGCHAVTVLDVSQRGAKLRSNLPLEFNDGVTLRAHGLPSQPARVRWTGDDLVGVQFASAISLPALAAWTRPIAARMAA